MNKRININASAITGSYDMIIGSVSSFSMVYLLANDMNEAMVGNLVALANLIATITQPYLANQADKSRKFSLYHYIVAILCFIIASLFGVLFFKDNIWLLFACYTLALALLALIQPFHNSLIMLLINKGYQVNFGISRAAGSMMFAISSTTVGVLVSRFGTDVIIIVGLLGALVYFAANTLIKRNYLAEDASRQFMVNPSASNPQIDQIKMPFYTKYPSFVWVLFGALNLFISHNIINTFMFQILNRVGGGASEMGFAFSLAAMVEVPSMVLYTTVTKNMTHQKALKISSLFFVVKALLTLLADSVYLVYFAQLFQALSFAVYIVASAYYTNSLMKGNDKVKGQAYLAAFQTTGGIIGGSLGGWIITQYSLNSALVVSLIATLIGAVCFQFGLSTRKD